MKKTTLTAITSLCLASFSIALAAPCFAAPYKSAQFGYTLTIPDDWKQIPQDVIDQYTKRVQNPNSPNMFNYAVGFQPIAHQNGLQHPYVLVQVSTYDQNHQNRQINEDEFPQAIQHLTGVDLRKLVDEKMSDDARKLMKDMAISETQLDTLNHRFL